MTEHVYFNFYLEKVHSLPWHTHGHFSHWMPYIECLPSFYYLLNCSENADERTKIIMK